MASNPLTVIKSIGKVSRWLVDGDAAVRWQIQRDLLGAEEGAVDRERRKVAREGWGARLLSLQDDGGTWGGGLYNPKWTSTTYTMMLLRDFGLMPSNPRAKRAGLLLLDHGLQRDGGVNFGHTIPSEACITGMVLSIASYFQCDDDRLDTIAGHLLEQQMADGGWNCHRPFGATHSSVHTTISVLEGLRQYELNRRRKIRQVRSAQERGREFLLIHHLFRSHNTGKVIKSEFKRFSFPPRWHYDILRALDYFRAVNAPHDRRLAEAIAIVREHQRPDGRWLLPHLYPGRVFFDLERPGGPSRWNTLRALRVLMWWER